MKSLLLTVFLALATACGFAAEARPNIVVILVDDMGFSDVGCYGSEILTPNIDRLAKEGVRFTSFYNTGRCCPTRAALLSGLYPHQAGIGQMVDDYSKQIRANLNSPAYTDRLSDRAVTIGEALSLAGYETMMSGKWHVGAMRDAWPDKRGFSRSFCVVSGAMNYFGGGIQHVGGTTQMQMQLDGTPWTPPQEGFYSTDAFADQAITFIKERKDPERPFFLYLAFNAPHWPLQALPEDIAKYRGKYMKGFGEIRKDRLEKQKAMGLFPKDTPLPPRDVPKPWDNMTDDERKEWDLRMAIYAAQVDRMDQNVGKLLATLKETGTEQNTLVLFLSDNGGCHEGIDRGKPGAEMGTRDSYTSYRRAWAQVSNTPFRMYKHWTHEGGICTPLIARWPAGIEKVGGYVNTPGHVIDLMTTALAAAGAKYPETYHEKQITPAEGINLIPAMRGEEVKRTNPIFWEHEGNRAVREGQWKIVAKFKGEWELYNLATDRTETKDVAAENPEVLADLVKKYDTWAERTGVKDWALAKQKE